MSNTDFLIWLYGDSLSLPRENNAGHKDRYIYRLKYLYVDNYKNYNIDVMDRSKASATIVSQYDQYWHDINYFQENRNVLVIQLGVCDCAPRPIPPYVRNNISKLKGIFKTGIISLIKRIRKNTQKRNIFWRNVELDVFKETYTKWLLDAKDKFTHIYILNIAPTDDITERKSPGFQESIYLYNTCINNIISEINSPNIILIDIFNGVNKENIYDYILKEDGHHITIKGHQLYFELLKEKILQNNDT